MAWAGRRIRADNIAVRAGTPGLVATGNIPPPIPATDASASPAHNARHRDRNGPGRPAQSYFPPHSYSPLYHDGGGGQMLFQPVLHALFAAWINAFTLAWSFFPGDDSTPLETST